MSRTTRSPEGAVALSVAILALLAAPMLVGAAHAAKTPPVPPPAMTPSVDLTFPDDPSVTPEVVQLAIGPRSRVAAKGKLAWSFDGLGLATFDDGTTRVVSVRQAVNNKKSTSAFIVNVDPSSVPAGTKAGALAPRVNGTFSTSDVVASRGRPSGVSKINLGIWNTVGKKVKRVRSIVSATGIALHAESIGEKSLTFENPPFGGTFSWTVPPDVFSAKFELFGASGGGWGTGSVGRGLGGKTTATIPVVPGEVLRIVTGQRGFGRAPGTSSNGGGGGGFGGRTWYLFDTGQPMMSISGDGFAGGGATDVRRGLQLADRILVAGGGGGDGGQSTLAILGGVDDEGNPYATSAVLVPSVPGGHGGGLSGAPGASGASGAYQSAPAGGGAGTQTVGGLGGAGSVDNRYGPEHAPADAGDDAFIAPVINPVYLTGGLGGGDSGSGGGGGGGGWFPGGGGGACFFTYGNDGANGAGGGGGSSFGPSDGEFLQGVHTGDGMAVVTYAASPGVAPTTTTVTSSLNSSTSGAPVTFTAVVAPKAPGTGTPTGTVRFEVDGVAIASGDVTLVNGEATSPAISTLTVGAHAVRAIYSGDADFAPSASPAAAKTRLNQVVNP